MEVCLYNGYCNNFRYNSIFCDLRVPKSRATFSIVSCDTFWQFQLRLYSSAFCYIFFNHATCRRWKLSTDFVHKVESMYVIFRHFSANWHYITGSCYIFAEMYVVKGLSYCQNPICFWFSSQLFITSFSRFWVTTGLLLWNGPPHFRENWFLNFKILLSGKKYIVSPF